MHKNESMKQPNRSELSILTFLMLIIQKEEVLKKMVSQSRTGANLVVSQILKIGTLSKRHLHILNGDNIRYFGIINGFQVWVDEEL